MNSAQAAHRFERAAQRLQAGGQSTAELTRQDLQRTAVRWSSGRLTARALRKLDHPYARRHGVPLKDPRRINVRSSRFRASWVSRVRQRAGSQQVRAENTDPKAAAVLQPGTTRMFARPIDRAIRQEVEPRAEKRVRQMLGDALKELTR